MAAKTKTKLPPAQLQMVWPGKKRPKAIPVPRGYKLRTYRAGDAVQYSRVMRGAGFKEFDRKAAGREAFNCLPNGLFFIEHTATKRIVATAVANHSPTWLHPNAAQLGWVAGDPKHKGKKLGTIVSAAVVNRFLDMEYKDIFLLTDDWRLAAVKAYLNLGFVPFLYRRDMKKRWLEVFENLGLKPKLASWQKK